MIARPSKLYKYEAFSVQSLQNLKAQSVYFGSPKNFNDPFDCAVNAIPVQSDLKDLHLLRQKYLDDDAVPAGAKQELLNANDEALRQIIYRSTHAVIAEGRENFLSNRGITCFSESNDDLLMWAHYGGNCKGYCLEFSTEDPLFEKSKPVRYVDCMPQIDVMKSLVREDYDWWVDLYCTKSSAWGYEKEWRCIHNEVGTLFTYQAKNLTGVYFGPAVDPESMEITCLVLAGQNPFVKLWQGKLAHDRFEIEFTEFTYTSFKDVKNRRIDT